jgi:hypothetical protein
MLHSDRHNTPKFALLAVEIQKLLPVDKKSVVLQFGFADSQTAETAEEIALLLHLEPAADEMQSLGKLLMAVGGSK